MGWNEGSLRRLRFIALRGGIVAVAVNCRSQAHILDAILVQLGASK